MGRSTQEGRELLIRFLRERNEDQALKWLEVFLHEFAVPLINAVLRRKLGVDLLRRRKQREANITAWKCPECGTEATILALVCPLCGTRRQVPSNPFPLTAQELDAEDIFGEAMTALIDRLWQWWERPEKAPLDYLPQYLVRLTLNTLAQHRRQQFPNLYRLRSQLLYLLERQGKGFALWEGKAPGEQLCGFVEWQGRPRCSSERYHLWSIDPHRCALDALPPGSDPKTMPLPQLLAHLFHWLGGPIELDDLLAGLAELLDIHDLPLAELPDGMERAEDFRVAEEETTSDFLFRLWDTLWQLSVPQRQAFLLKQEREVWECFIQHGCGSWKDFAQLLEIPLTALQELLPRLPLSDAEIARQLHLPHRQKVINLRHAALRRLRRWLENRRP